MNLIGGMRKLSNSFMKEGTICCGNDGQAGAGGQGCRQRAWVSGDG